MRLESLIHCVRPDRSACMYVGGKAASSVQVQPEIFWLVPRQKLGMCNLGVKEPEKPHTVLMTISLLQDAAAALVGRKLLQNSIAVFLQGIKTGSLKTGLISCFLHAEKMTFHTDGTIGKKCSEGNPLLPSFL